jgi:predicted transposase YbfD/YdcC
MGGLMENFKEVFTSLQDPRAANARHLLLDVLVIALAATLCGAESCADMADFGCAKEALLRQFLRLPHGIPSHDTFSRVFRLLDPKAFEAVFREFVASFAKSSGLDLGGVVAIDGKALRGAFERGGQATPLHMVNVWAADARVVLAQCLAPDRNEVAGALEVLRLLSLEHCIVTADALHCHRRMGQTILDQGGSYVLALKENQSALYSDVALLFRRAGPRGTATQLEPSTHDRCEQRTATVVRNTSLAIKHAFPGIVAVARITSRRRVKGRPADDPLVRYFLLSKYLPAERLLQVVRSHWGIENQLHWVLDVAFDEDANRARKDNAPENLAVLRGLALNILRSHPERASIRRKIKRAGWDDAFLLSLLTHMQ